MDGKEAIKQSEIMFSNAKNANLEDQNAKLQNFIQRFYAKMLQIDHLEC